jgi:hypothetical protein
MFKNLHIVLAMWFIIVGGVIIFINGDRGCIACNGILLNVVGAITLLIGLIGVASKFTAGSAVARE